MTQWVRVLDALTEDQGSVPSTHMVTQFSVTSVLGLLTLPLTSAGSCMHTVHKHT